MEVEKPIIVLFRRDLRLFDNPALFHAAAKGAVVPLYIYDEAAETLGGAAKWWLHHALLDLSRQLAELGVPLLIRAGDTEAELRRILEETQAAGVCWNRRYEPFALKQEAALTALLQGLCLEHQTFESHLLLEPWAVRKSDGTPYKVFTAFYKALQKKQIPAPLRKPKHIQSSAGLHSLAVPDLKLLPNINWTSGMEQLWNPTEKGAYQKLKLFLSRKLPRYSKGRDIPAAGIHSALSPYLAFGQLSPRLVHYYITEKLLPKQEEHMQKEAECFLRQLVWRDFAYHLLFHFPHTTTEPLNPAFRTFPWEGDSKRFEAWTKGTTGYPIVDAGMRELWETGFMHNRVRMITASFLVKHLLIPWQDGAAWFWDTLLDADLANNTMGWQWTAGSGADAAPYFRIFNPVTQGEKFDKDGEYVRRWVPELRSMPAKYIHKPWEAPLSMLQQAGVELGSTYPAPIVEHTFARNRALQAYEQMKKAAPC